MAVRDIVVRLRADIRGFERDLARGGDVARRQAEAMDKVGKGAVVMGAAMVAGLLVSAKAAIEWESAWAGVTKTVDGTAEQMQMLEDDLRQMATTLPITAVELAGVAESAGQLGVKREDIAAFTKTMVDLGVSTNLTADMAATDIAKIANVMGTFDKGPDAIARFGAALVALGNDGASTEADILAMATRIAGAAKLVGASESDVLGLSNALSSMGVQAELGGGVMTRALLKMYESVNEGGKALEGFAEVAGVSASEFATQFKGEPIEALDSFIQGLSRIEDEGGNVVGALKSVGLEGTYNMQVLLQLKGAGDLLTDSLELGNRAWADNAALVDEANKRYDTTESKIKIAKNNMTELMITLGTHLLPAIQATAGAFGDLASFLAGLPEPVQQVLVIVGALGAGLLLVGGAALMLVPRIAAMQAGLIALGVSATTAATAMARLALAAKLVGAATVLGAVAAGAYYVGKNFKDAAPAAGEFAKGLASFEESGRVSGEVANKLGENFEKLGKRVKVANNNKLSVLDGTGMNEVESAREILGELDKQLAGLVASGNADAATALYAKMTTAIEEQGGSVKKLNEKLPAYGEAQRAAADATKAETEATYKQAEALGGVTAGYDNAYVSLAKWAEAKAMDKDGTEALIKQVDEWATALGDFVVPLDAYTDVLTRKQEAEQASAEKSSAVQNESVDSQIKAVHREAQARIDAMRKNKGTTDAQIQAVEDTRDKTVGALEKQKKGWEDYAGTVAVSVKDYLGELDKQVRAQETWQGDMLALSARVSTETLDELARMGPEGAPLVAQLVNASDAELAKLEDLFARRTAEATGSMAAELFLANNVLPQIAGSLGTKTALALAQQLAAGTTTVAEIARKYGAVLDQNIPPTKATILLLKTDGVFEKIAAVQVALGRLDSANVDVFISEQHRDAATANRLAGHAAGGKIRGAGTGTSDSNIRRVSNGEWVVRQSASTMYGDAKMAAVNAGTAQVSVGTPMQMGPVAAQSGGLSPGDVADIAVALSRMAPRVTRNEFSGPVNAPDWASLQREAESQTRLKNLGGGV